MTPTVEYGTHVLEFTLERVERTTLSITVEPHGEISVVAPSDATDEAIRARVHRRGRWIIEQQRFFAQFLLIDGIAFDDGENIECLVRSRYRGRAIRAKNRAVSPAVCVARAVHACDHKDEGDDVSLGFNVAGRCPHTQSRPGASPGRCDRLRDHP